MACQCLYDSTLPHLGDSKAVLYRKWVQFLSQQQSGAHAPAPGDWSYNSLVKILFLLNAASGDSCGN